ncbi:nucleotidyltransferase [Butyrivibrio sp. LC3010]|uniref:nucleotidyltransferase n=1 Tax=Butyrivibrio sp. LC3010 TaxID=1280680 RepID=UPI0003FF530A|nr:nucleotidyltransferase [Butyrivibrio sp. LC3010]
MKTVGIIAEFNPFHKGHEYLIRALKEQTGSDYAVIIMSGDFTQRGAPAIFDKYTRTKMALSCGADLILELPIYYSTSSAEFFAGGAISILDKLDCIDYLGFGSESGNIEALQKISTVLANEPSDFSAMIKENLKSGKNYAVARAAALSAYLGEDASFLSEPNDILGTEYIKALTIQKSSMVPFCIKREGASYSEDTISDNPDVFASAKALRSLIEDNADISASVNNLKSQLPTGVFDLLKELCESKALKICTPDNFSTLLHYKLISEKNAGFDKYLDVSSDFSDKINANIRSFSSITGFTDKLKSKDLTYTRISRALLHILLGLTKENMSLYVKDKDSFTSYARILGLNKNASPLLKKIQECSRIPVISKLSDAYKALSEEEYSLLSETIVSSNIYDLINSRETINEYAKTLITISR